MVSKCHCMVLLFIVFSTILTTWVFESIDPIDVPAVGDLYETLLNLPLKFQKWNLGDSVESLTGTKIQGLNLTGNLGTPLHNLQNLNMLRNMSYNLLSGRIHLLCRGGLDNVMKMNIIDSNVFSSGIPWHFKLAPNHLWLGVNPLDMTTQANGIDSNYSSHRKKLVMAFVVGGGTIIVTGLAIFAIRTKQLNKKNLKSFKSSLSSLQSDDPVIITIDSPVAREETPSSLMPATPTSLMPPRRLPPLLQYITQDMLRRRAWARTKFYSMAELHIATNGFSEYNFLGEGSLGYVYRAVFPNGPTLAVKHINMSRISLYEEHMFLDAVSISSRLKHPNIVELNGYCMEHGQHLLVYEYVPRSLNLYDVLHSSDSFMPLSWPIRLRIALGVAYALKYMHSMFSPPVAHGKLNSAYILLDENLMPHVCDCGLSILRSMMRYKMRAAAEEGVGCNPKDDVYAFGVLLLELLTGRKPYDGSRPREEQYLATWALARLHDNASLEQMLDPIIQGTLSPKALSRYADIISLCLHPVKGFRPIMSTVVDLLHF